MAEKENAMVEVCNTHKEVDACIYIPVSCCIADKEAKMKNIIEDTVAIEFDKHQIEPLEVLHRTLLIEGYEMRYKTDPLLGIILSNLKATSK